ncbi:MAG: aspartate--tRNA ligase [Chlamydiales bacterium]|nr:aspartate--tRNA ligase [Chlamydiales bacterium]
MLDYRRSHHCGELKKEHIKQEVVLSGWVHRRRDHGGVIFIDLRDKFGLTQLIFDPDLAKEAHLIAQDLRSEWVLCAKGKVRPRAPGMANPKLKTGDIEVEVYQIEILSKAKIPPFSIAEEELDVNEELRLKYRYLDIRRGDVLNKLQVRHRAMMVVRNYLDKHAFSEITTPILGKSTPEGARDYLVPSRVHPGKFYALPQSPQIFKQLLMVSGLDRYFQIAQCFRDEDLRADRQPEFTQIDLEMSFITKEEIMSLVEGLLKQIFEDVSHIQIPTPFIRMKHKDCMENYGTDRPDIRFDMTLIRLDEIVKNSTFSVFVEQLSQGGIIKGICVKQGSDKSRKDIDGYTDFVKGFGLQGLAWMKKTAEGFQSSIVKFFNEQQLHQIEKKMNVQIGDLILIAAGPEGIVNQSLDHLRRHIAKESGLMDPSHLKFLWVEDFPLFSYNDKEMCIQSEHHPFTAPHPSDISKIDTHPFDVRAVAYDVVLNGYEIGGGSQRIHNQDLQKKIFEVLQLTDEEIKEKFGFFIDALSYGTPPHAGLALGFDRIIMIITKTDNIRDVIAFPKTQKAYDLMMDSPATVHEKQLHELNIQVEDTKNRLAFNK